MSMVCRLSIIVPVYGVEDYLAKCLDSLVNQSVDGYKIIVVNDGSKDNSQLIIEEYERRYPEIVKGYIKENGGLSDARNYGMKYVDTPYVMFIDADDFVEKTMVEECLNIIEQGYDLVVFSYFQHHVFDNTDEIIELKLNQGIYNPKINKEVLAFMPNAAWNKIYRTSLFTDNNILFPKGLLYEDLGTTPKLLICTEKVYFLNKPLYHYLVDRPNNITRQIDNRIFDVIEIMDQIIKYFKKKGCFETYVDELHYLYKVNTIENMRKVMKSSDYELAYRYINYVFDKEMDLFKKSKVKYEINLDGTDVVYSNRLLAKLYYFIKKMNKGGRE